MMHKYLPSGQRLLTKIQKLYRQLQALTASDVQASHHKIKMLSRRRNKYVKQLLSLTAPLSRAAGAVALTAALANGAEAQNCRALAYADAANPIIVKDVPANRHPYFVDIDGDGDLDCYVLGEVYYYDAPFFLKNVGTNKLPVYQYMPSESGFALGHYALDYPANNMQFVDIDGDGDYDCFLAEAYPILGTFGGIHVKYFENQGTLTKPHFVANEAKNPVGFTYAFYHTNFTFADIDSDGDLDFYYTADYESYLYKNTGTKTAPQFEYADFFLSSASRTYYDWNKDGLLDYFENGAYYKNIGPKSKPKYVADNADGPQFGNGGPHQFTDINGDGSPEVFNDFDGFSTLAPVPVIDTSTLRRGGRTYTKLTVSPVKPGYTYQWYLNKRLLINQTSPSVPALSAGYYTATITDSCGTGNSLPYRIINKASSSLRIVESVSTLPSEPVVTAYPNPFTSTFSLRLGTAYKPGTTVSIADVQGRIVSSVKAPGGTLILGDRLQKGIYLLQVWQDGVVVFTQKIMKQ